MENVLRKIIIYEISPSFPYNSIFVSLQTSGQISFSIIPNAIFASVHGLKRYSAREAAHRPRSYFIPASARAGHRRRNLKVLFAITLLSRVLCLIHNSPSIDFIFGTHFRNQFFASRTRGNTPDARPRSDGTTFENGHIAGCRKERP